MLGRLRGRVVAVALVGVPHSLAWADPACVATDICAPGVSPCVISADYEIGDMCVLDFGDADVVMEAGSTLDVAGGLLILRAGSLWVQNNASMRARTTDLPGGQIVVITRREILSSGSWDASSNHTGGVLDLTAGEDITLTSGGWQANGRVRDADGGSISLRASGSVVTDTVLDVSSGSASEGGLIRIVGDERVVVNRALRAGGGEFDGGRIVLDAGLDVDVASIALDVNAGGDAGYGGSVSIHAGRDIFCDATVTANGVAGDGYGGDGGPITLTSGGSTLLGAKLESRGGGLDGSGASVRITAGVDAWVDGPLNAHGPGSESGGGFVRVVADRHVNILRPINVSAGDSGGGSVVLRAGEDLHVVGNIMANGGNGTGDGGPIALNAEHGLLRVDATVRSNGATDGDGSNIDVAGCTVEVFGTLDADTGGTSVVSITGNDAILVDGVVRASDVVLTYREDAPDVARETSPPATLVHAPELASCACADADADRVCDADDVCAGADDWVDTDLDRTPDGCDPFRLVGVMPLREGVQNRWVVSDATPGGEVAVVWGPQALGATPVPGCPGLFTAMPVGGVVGTYTADGFGAGEVRSRIPHLAMPLDGVFQGVDLTSCELTEPLYFSLP